MNEKRTVENIQLEQALEHLVISLSEIPKNVNTPLAYNLKLLAIIVDAEYIKQFLSALINDWKEKLPFIGEIGTEIDWAEIKTKLYEVWDEEPYDCNCIKAKFADLYVYRDKREWNHWEVDENEGINVDSNKYGESLNPTNWHNLWFFAGKEIAEIGNKIKRDAGMTTDNSLTNIRKGIRCLSNDSNYLLVNTLDKELDAIIELIDKIEAWMFKLQSINDNKYLLDDIMSSFFRRLYDNDFWNERLMIEGTEIKEEFNSWQAEYNEDMQINTLIGKQNLEFELLLNSGFLDIFLTENSCSSYQIVEARKLFDKYFYDEEKCIRYAAAGRYIYAHQFKERNWRQKTISFLRFLYIDDMVGRHIYYLDKYYNNDALRLNSVQIAVRSSLNKVMDLKNGNSYLILKQHHWIAIYRVLIDENIFDIKPSKYKKFVELINEISPDSFRVPLSMDSIKNISKTVYQKDIKDWKYDSNYEGWDDVMPIIAKEYRDILLCYLNKYHLR